MADGFHNKKSIQGADFGSLIRLVSDVIKEVSGIHLGDKQATMIQSRLTRRMLDLNLVEPKSYEAFIHANRHTESIILVSLLTTHHTYFFREFEQFAFLQQGALTDIAKKIYESGRNCLRIWSMACSRGQEVYSLSMFLYRHLKDNFPGMGYEILGTDIDPDSVAVAKNGVYRWDEIKEVPSLYLDQHWARGTEEISGFVMAKPSIKAHCRFKTFNLLEPGSFSSDVQYDLIFCRNVFLYFTDSQVEMTTKGILSVLAPWGMLFVGISESLNNRNLPLTYLGQSIYTKKNVLLSQGKGSALAVNGGGNSMTFSPKATQKLSKDPIRVFCVDDSPTVLSMLKAMLTPEYGFLIVATAADGFDAADWAKDHDFDVMTLDIHMPKQGGVDYLKANFGPNHPPVVIVSSVSREEASLGLKTLELGAADYVEKPSFANLSEQGDELRTKIRCAVLANRGSKVSVGEVRNVLATFSHIENPDKKFRLVVAGIADRQKTVAIIRQLVEPQPPTVILFECADSLLPAFSAQIMKEYGRNLEILSITPGNLAVNTIYIGTVKGCFQQVKNLALGRRSSILIFCDVSKETFAATVGWSGAQLIGEDPGYIASEDIKFRQMKVSKCVPYTNFLFHSDHFLNRES
jgi:chemotaxis protein methyltransferase CheR